MNRQKLNKMLWIITIVWIVAISLIVIIVKVFPAHTLYCVKIVGVNHCSTHPILNNLTNSTKVNVSIRNLS
jgi:hypothetical protein